MVPLTTGQAGLSVVAPAFAKLNLALAVSPPEPAGSARAGWHRIVSWFVAIELAGSVRAQVAACASFSTGWASDAPSPTPIDWPMDRDLAWRALGAAVAVTGRDLRTRVVVTKRAPVGGGLGGGSSEAAGALLAIRSAHTLGLGAAELARCGAALGSDVPFFLDARRLGDAGSPPRPALVRGFGDEIERTVGVRAGVVLLIPPLACPTRAVYAAFDAQPARDLGAGEIEAAARAGDALGGPLRNDLEAAARRVEPRVGEMLDAARRVHRGVSLTGSGACAFALTPEGEAEALARLMRESFVGVRVVATQTVG